MKALVFDGNLKLTEVRLPERAEGESLVKVRSAGICATDREIFSGYMDFRGIPGHEFVGVVVETDDDNLIGKRVVGEINCGCGTCEMCMSGLERHCPVRTVLGIAGRNGAFAEYLTLPDRNLVEVPGNINDNTAVFTEPLAAGLEIFEQIKIDPKWKILIIGDGRLAALTAQIFKVKSHDVSVIGRSENKLRLLESWGMRIVPELTESGGYDVVVEASGSPEGWDTAVKAVKPRGYLVLKSTYHGNLNFNPAVLVINEINLIGSRCGRFEPALKLLSEGRIDTDSIISRVFDFDDIIEAVEYAGQPETMKVLVEFA